MKQTDTEEMKLKVSKMFGEINRDLCNMNEIQVRAGNRGFQKIVVVVECFTDTPHHIPPAFTFCAIAKTGKENNG